jgi:hypothetical protein
MRSTNYIIWIVFWVRLIYFSELGILSYQPLLKIALLNLDFVLYMLNRRIRPQEICETKFKIIELIHKNSLGNEILMEKNIYEQFTKYINKGPN